MVNIGLLTLFKYIPFIEESLLLLSFKIPFEFSNQFNYVLPAGISFYTFQTLSYVFDAFKRKIRKSPKALDYFLYVSYFPQLVAGPILRPSDFFDEKSLCKVSSYNSNITKGFQRICFGLFLKLCLADELSRLNDVAFNSDFRLLSSLDAWTMAFGFGLQIYFDFSGYSHMAIGISRIIGLPIRENFLLPLSIKSATEFWRKWHISLSSWVSDYLYSFLNVKLPLWFWIHTTFIYLGNNGFMAWLFMEICSLGHIKWSFVLIHRFYKDFNSNYKFLKFFSIPIISWSINFFNNVNLDLFQIRMESGKYSFLKLWKFDFNLSLRENYYLFVFMFS